MCWDRRFGKCFDTKFARRVRNFYVDNNLLVYGVVGHILSTMVFFDMVEKLSGGSDASWSPLRMLGPTLWLPLKTTAGKLMAAQTLVHSIMYFVACYYLVQARYRKNMRLMAPWIVMHCFFMVYQIVLIMENRGDYPFWEVVLGISDFLLHVILLVTASYTGINLKPHAQPRRAEGAAQGAELEALNAQSEEDPASTGHSAETIEVTDETWSLPPPPSYEVTVRTPSHADSSLALQQENREEGIYVSWPWRWRLLREVARSAAVAAAAADPTTVGIEMQVLAVMSAAPRTPEAATLTADEAQTSGTAVVMAAEPQISEAEIVGAAEARPSEAQVVVTGESQPSGSSVEPPARRTGWLGRWRWRSVLRGTRAEEASGDQAHVSTLRRRSVGGSEPAAKEPLLQPSQ